MLIPVGYLQANFVFSGDGAPTGAEVTCGFDHSASAVVPETMAELLYDNWGLNILQQQSAEIRLERVEVKLGPNDTGFQAVFIGGDDGALSGGNAGPGISFLARKLTGLGGRQGTGRMFIPGVVEQYTAGNGDIVDPLFSGMQTQLDNFWDACIADSLVPVLLRSVGSPISAPAPITRFVLDQKTATQRRRLRR